MFPSRQPNLLSLAVAAAVSLHAAGSWGANVGAATAVPEGATDVVVDLKGTGMGKGEWTGTMNGSPLPEADINTGFRPKDLYLPETLESLEIRFEGLTFAEDANGALAYMPTSGIELSFVGEDLTLESKKKLHVFRLQAPEEGSARVEIDLHDVRIGAETQVRGVRSDNGADGTDRRFESIAQRVERMNGEGLFYGALFSGPGRVSVDRFALDVVNSDVKEIYGVYDQKANELTFGAFNMSVVESDADKLWGLYYGEGSAVRQTGDFRLSVEGSALGILMGMWLAEDDVCLMGDLSVELNGSSVTATGKASAALYLAPPQGASQTIQVSGDVAFTARNSSSVGEFCTVQLVSNASYAAQFDGSDITLTLTESASSRIRALHVTSKGAPRFTLNDGSVSLFLEGVSTTRASTSNDDPAAVIVAGKGEAEFNRSDVRVTLRANPKNALWSDSLYGIAMHGTTARAEMTGDIVVTLEGDAKDLGFGRKDDGTAAAAIGGIFAVAKHGADTAHFEQDGRRILQIGSADMAFTSTSEAGLAAPFANFTHVEVTKGSNLVLTEAQGSEFIHDSGDFGNAQTFDVGVSSKGGALVVAGSDDASEIGIILGAGTELRAESADFTGHATVSAPEGAATLGGETLRVKEGAVVSIRTDGKTEEAALRFEGNLENKGALRLEGSALAFESNAQEETNLGRVETADGKGGALHFGSGDFHVGEFVGEGKAIVMNDLRGEGAVRVDRNEGGLAFVATGEANDGFASAKASAEALADRVAVGSSDRDAFGVLIAEGRVNDAAYGTLDADGNLTLAIEKNTKLETYGALSSLSFLHWRHELGDLRDRLGGLRAGSEGVGAWARVYGSESAYGKESVTAKLTTLQVGGDVRVGSDWTVGAAFSHTDGHSTFDKGDADAAHYGFTFYGTRAAEDGRYVDLTARYGRLQNDFSVGEMTGKTRNDALAAGVAFGWHRALSGAAYVEPQAGLTYGRILGDALTAGNGVRLTQDDADSLAAHAGLRTGVRFADEKGFLYAHGTAHYEFLGELKSEAHLGVASNAVETDLGGAWFGFGVGADLRLTDATRVTLSLDRSTGGDVSEKWRWNVGVRSTF